MGYKHKKEDVLKAGILIFQKKGYYNVGVNEILEHANIPKGSFYNFFRSKEDFAIAVIHSYNEKRKELISAMMKNENLSPFNRLHSFYEYLSTNNENSKFLDDNLLNVFGNEIKSTNKLLTTVTDKSLSNEIYLLSDCIKEAQLLGEIRNDYTALDLMEPIPEQK